MKGTAYCVGVGPGDPELMTLKAARLIRENRIIAVPVKGAGDDPVDSAAYRIAAAAEPALAGKTLLPVVMPMTHSREELRAAHAAGAAVLEEILSGGENVVYLTLGDPTVYCSFSYLQTILEKDGYPVVLVSGVTSFCAASARAGMPLVSRKDTLHVFPSAPAKETLAECGGTCVIMKSAGQLDEITRTLREAGTDACMVENCGMEGERFFPSLSDFPEQAGYFSLILAKHRK